MNIIRRSAGMASRTFALSASLATGTSGTPTVRKISDGSRPAASACALRRSDFSAIDSGEPHECHTSAYRAAIEMLPLGVATGVRLGRFERVRPTLEDVFLALVGTAGEIRA